MLKISLRHLIFRIHDFVVLRGILFGKATSCLLVSKRMLTGIFGFGAKPIHPSMRLYLGLQLGEG